MINNFWAWFLIGGMDPKWLRVKGCLYSLFVGLLYGGIQLFLFWGLLRLSGVPFRGGYAICLLTYVAGWLASRDWHRRHL